MRDVSVVIVNYKTDQYLKKLLASIKKYSGQFVFEIIIVNNSKSKIIFKDKKVKTIDMNGNSGYSTACNHGALKAKGKYILFLNPDTLFVNDVAGVLKNFVKSKNNSICSPMLLDKNKKPYSIQGTQILTPLRNIIALGAINKYFPNNIVSKKFLYLNHNNNKVKKVGVIPGTCMFMEKQIFNNIGGFDEQIFLYFEDNDLCLRANRKRISSFVVSEAKLIHYWEKSTRQENSKKMIKIFNHSKFYYLKKHFGFVRAVFSYSLSNIGRSHLIFILFIIIIIIFIYIL